RRAAPYPAPGDGGPHGAHAGRGAARAAAAPGTARPARAAGLPGHARLACPVPPRPRARLRGRPPAGRHPPRPRAAGGVARSHRRGRGAMSETLRLAAVGDLHCTRTVQGGLAPLFAQAASAADVLLLCGDLTDYGLPEEARVLARELSGLSVPVLAVLG